MPGRTAGNHPIRPGTHFLFPVHEKVGGIVESSGELSCGTGHPHGRSYGPRQKRVRDCNLEACEVGISRILILQCFSEYLKKMRRCPRIPPIGTLHLYNVYNVLYTCNICNVLGKNPKDVKEMTTYKIRAGEKEFDVFGTLTPMIDKPTLKVKDWFYAKNVTNCVPSKDWTYVLAIVKETDKAIQVITKAADEDGGLMGFLFWVPKSCTEEIKG